MCFLAVTVDAQSSSTEVGKPSQLSGKRSKPDDERKEKSREAARERRAKEFEYFQVGSRYYSDT